MIDGQRFDPDRVDHRSASVRSRVDRGQRDTSDHVFHIHTNPFQVVAVNGEPVSEALWRRRHRASPRSLTLRSRFLDFTGKTVLHCHMMNHELGMMQLIEFTE